MILENSMKRLENVSPFIVMDIMKKANQIKNSIHFEVGQPDINPSENVIKKLHEAVDTKQFPYTESFGIYELRKKISEHYKKMYNYDLNPERVLLTVGTSGAFLIAYSLLLDNGETLALSDPSYPCYKNFSYLLNIKPRLIPVDKNTKYQLTPDLLQKYKDIKAVQISSPSNPTGYLYDNDNLRDLTDYCNSNNIYFISDEIYHGLTYSDKTEKTVLEFSDNAIVINGFSKYFCLPGIRLGWIILPEELMRKAEIIMQNLFICAPIISQIGALGAFDYTFLKNYKEEYRKRRDFLYNELKDIFEIEAKPEGAFYIWANIEKYSNNCLDFANELLENIGVAVTPGMDFGNNNTEKYIRFAYTRNIQHMGEGVERLKKYLKHKK
jgi:aspartate/methionine/tyrosine aminotransferase